MSGFKRLSKACGRSGALRRTLDPGVFYCLKLTDPNGRPLGDEQVRAYTDEHAIGMALRRLGEAAIVEVWRQTRWVGQVQRACGLL